MNTNFEYGITLENIVKKYKNNVLLDNISCNFEFGKIYGITGRNGSGKTMLLRLLSGLIFPDSGKMVVNGKEIVNGNIPEEIGAIIETPGFINYYTAFKNLKILASIKNIIDDKKIVSTMELLGLDPNDNRKIKEYSLGMRQKLGIVQAIMENPKIILLDEPMNSLDKESVKNVHNVLRSLKADGCLILLASHIAEDINLLCDEVLYMDCGRLSDVPF